MAIGANYVNLNNAHKKNGKLCASTRCDTFVDLVEEVGNIEMKNKYVRLISYYMTFVETKDVQWLNLKVSKILFSLCNLTTTHINIGPTMVEAMHNIVLQAIKAAI